MDEMTFWSLIDRFDWSKEEDDDIIEPAVMALALLPDSQIAEFQQILARKLYALDGRAWARQSGEQIWFGDPDRVHGGPPGVQIVGQPASFENVS